MKILSGALLMALLWTQPVHAQGLAGIVCMDRTNWTDLFKNMGVIHTSKGIGITEHNAIYEMFVTDDGHWILLKTFTNGQSCRISEGEGWIWLPIVQKPKGQGT